MAERLRIAQVAPIARPVAPYSGGSIEQIVSLLTEELVARGHDVTLFATGYSTTSARLEAIYPRGYDDDDDLWEWEFHELLHMAAALERAQEFDVVHSHVYHFGLPFTRLVRTPIVHTYHVLPDDDIVRAYSRYPEAQLVAISEYQRRKLDGLQSLPVIHHGIDVARFPFNDSPGDYLLFLGRVMEGKGPVEAIELAKRVGMHLVMAGPGDDYFRYVVEPLTRDPAVDYRGSVDMGTRNELLAGAAALLYPITSSETFGLVMVEAMACGTPVVALERGAVPEIVEHGLTGYFARDVDSLARLVPKALALDRGLIRESALTRFDRGRMVDAYLGLYQHVIATSRGPIAG
jgi:glycosyltransferase involved in cell wall biosynthesis